MMKTDRLFQALLIFLMLFYAQTVGAQQEEETEEVAQPVRYRMELVWIADGDSDARQYVFTVGAVGFRTVEGLKSFIARMARGAVLEWSPGCRRQGDEPLLSSPEELEDFKRFCAEHGIEFILHPSG